MSVRKITLAARDRRHQKVRMTVHGTGIRPRMAVFRSLKHIHVQLIDDDSRTTLAAASDQAELKAATKTERAERVGELIAKKAKEQNIHEVVFDRGGYHYHGRVKALADAARKAGLKF